uniref:5-hydroxytryptamine (serotonin) receptor 3A n=1 Tax=Neogobius melanostomus TaxID=47308 RepID=A0A8C6ULT0_9GOBI
MIMDVVGFFLPPDSGERVSFKITLLLGYSVFLIIVSDTLPATAIGTPLIGVYFVVCMALLVISLTETVLIVRLVHKQDLQTPVPQWLKYLVLEKAPALLCCPRRRPTWSTCTLHHSSDFGRRRSHHDRDGGLLLGFPPSRDPPAPPPVMNSILQEVTAIRHVLEKRDRCREVAKEWLQVGYVLDVLLFRVYLVAIVTYSITMCTLWAVWQGA